MEGRNTACLYLPEWGLMLDAGTGIHRARPLLSNPDLTVLLSHAHLDHVCGLTYLHGILFGTPVQQVTVRGLDRHLEAVTAGLFDNALFPIGPRFVAQPLPASPPTRVGGVDLHWRLQNHPGGSLGWRLETAAGRMAYITDLTADPDDAEAIAFLRGVDLLIHECNFPDELADLAAKTGHSTASAVGKVAAAAGVGQLVITHLDPVAGPVSWATVHRQVCRYYPRAVLAAEPMVIGF